MTSTAASATTTAAASSEANTPLAKQYFTGIVKQVLDGGAVVIRGQPRNGPPPERILALAEIDAPRLGRRPQQSPAGGTASPATPDEAYAWESREFLRKLLVGKSVLGSVSHTVPTSGREYGAVLFGSSDPEAAENAAVRLVSEGLARVRETSQDATLREAQDAAKSAKKGVWSGDPESKHIRNVIWEMENPRQLVDKLEGKPVKAVIEHVRDGTTVRTLLLPDFHHITLMLSGVRSPAIRMGSEGKPDPQQSEPFSLEAHYFTESRLLQRDVEVILESVNNRNLVGSIIHPNGNIAEALLREGLAKCVDWSLKCVTGGPEKYRQAQAAAKERRVRLWKDYTGPSGPQVAEKDRAFTGRVVEIVNGDAIVIKRGKGDLKKVHLASVRPPRLPEGAQKPKNFRPLYDIPHMFDAREFLRKKLIGQSVQVTVDYIQPANTFMERVCATVSIGGVNVAEALVAKGLATVVRYSADNDQRSSHYDDLLAAEEKAAKSSKGLHDKKSSTPAARRIADLSGDVAKSKQFLPFLQRAGRMQAVVEFVASGSRFRVYIPRETCVITFLLSGISCPRASRQMPGGIATPADPFGDEALAFVKEMVLQKEVDIEVETIDKGGNFIGWMHLPEGNTNVSVALVEEGYAEAFGAEWSSYGRQIQTAEDNAKRRKERRWANYTEPEENADNQDSKEQEEEKDIERKTAYQKVVVTEVTPEGRIYAQHVDEGPKLEQLMNELRSEFSSNPPMSGAYTAKRGDLCAAKFEADDEWYRAKVEKISGADVSVLYVDYGNRASVAKSKCVALPGTFAGMAPFAKEYALAMVQLAPDDEYAAQGLQAMREDLLDRGPLNLNVESRGGPGLPPYVTLSDPESKDDPVKNLVADGLLMTDRKAGGTRRNMAKIFETYTEAMERAKKSHLNMWEYGDITADDAKEFGAGR